MQGWLCFFPPTVKAKILLKHYLEPGRLLIVRAEISSFCFLFVNIYASNTGPDGIKLFIKLKQLRQNQSEDFIILGGDWNCTLVFTLDRIGEEPHSQSALCLASVTENHFLDVWREQNLSTRQYTWVKVSAGLISAARLDRFYVSGNMRNRVRNATIVPMSFSDHKLITVDCVLDIRPQKSYYWHFNIRLLEDDKLFIERFKLFWES